MITFVVVVLVTLMFFKKIKPRDYLLVSKSNDWLKIKKMKNL